jgi:hypothetical protein
MAAVDWDAFRLNELAASVRATRNSADGEKTIWAFEEAIRIARIDEGLLDYLLVAVVCLIARVTAESPRAVLEAYFRRSVGDDEWRLRYLPLLGEG